MFLGGTRSGPMALTDEFALVAQCWKGFHLYSIVQGS